MLGNLLKTIGSSVGLSAPEAPKFAVPDLLPAIQTPSAAELAEKAGLKMPEGVTADSVKKPADLLKHLLNEKEDMLGATQAIAHGMPPKEGLKWAVDACKQVEAKLPPEGREAIMAADAFAFAPNAANRTAAAAAAAKAGMQSPAGLAAKAASMMDAPDAPPVPGSAKLVPTCVAGAVACAAALSKAKAPKVPETVKTEVAKPILAELEAKKPSVEALAAVQPAPGPGSPQSARNANAFKPFIEAGLALAAGAALKGRT
jgi:hypothetical protein